MVLAGSGYDGYPVSHYYAFDASDLTNVLWRFAVGSYECAGSTPAVAGDWVIFGNGSSLTRVNKTNGDLDWMTDISSGTIYGSAAIDIANDRVYVATASGSLALLHALNFTDGSLIWTGYSVIDFTDGTPAILDIDHIYISGNAYGSQGHTYCFNSTGIEQWRVPSGSWAMSPAVADGKLFTGNCDDMCGWGFFEGIGVYDAMTGAPVWSYEYAGSSPSVANLDGMVVSIGKGGRVYAFYTIPAAVLIKPETLNLNASGVFTAVITLPEGYDVANFNVSTVECEGGYALSATISAADSGTLVVKFDKEDLRDDLPAGDVEMTVSGELTDGTRFEGSDTVRVISKGA